MSSVAVSRLQDLQAGMARRQQALTALGALLVAIWLFGLAIPASIIQFQMPIKWTAPIAHIFGPDITGLVRFTLIVAALWVAYIAAVLIAVRLRSGLRMVVALSVAMVAVTLFAYPGGSRDIWHNIADGRLIAIHGQNPMLMTPYVYSRIDPVMAAMSAWDFVPTPSYYGPLWYVIAASVSFLAGDRLLANLIAFKGINAMCFLVALWQAYRLAEQLRPGSGLAAAVIFGWNPLVLWSGPLDGHNDIIMVALMLAALHEAFAQRYETSLPLLFLAAATKYTVLLVLPVILIYAWKSLGRRSMAPVATGLAGGLALSVALWLPFWQGLETLRTLRESATGAVQSPVAALLHLLNVSRTSIFEVPAPFALAFMLGFLALSAFCLVQFLRLPRPAPSDAVRTALVVLIGYLYLGLWWFWPQYISWVAPLAAVLMTRVALAMVVAFGASAMLIVMFHGWWWTLAGPDQAVYNELVGVAVFLPPLVCAALAAWRTFASRRTGTEASGASDVAA